MSIDLKGRINAIKAYRNIRATHGDVLTALDSVWHWLNGVSDAIVTGLGKAVADWAKTLGAAFSTVVDAYGDLFGLYGRIYTWVISQVLNPLRNQIAKLRADLLALIAQRVQYLEELILLVSLRLMAAIITAVNAEASARARAVKLAEARAAQEDTALHQTIEREAASAYRVEHDNRVSTVKRLLDFAVTRNPELRFAVTEVTDILLGLLSVDNPIARLAAGFIVKDLIDKLGVDRLVGSLADDMLGPLLGDPAPANLHDVIKDMSARLAALEAFAATFAEDGGSQVEQTGRLWRDVTNPLAAAGIVGVIATAAIDPTRWASVISGTVGVAASDVVSATERLIREA